MEITEALETIINARYGREVRQAIHDGIKQAYEDAIKNGNANMEVSQARGNYPSLGQRLNESDDNQRQTTAQLAQTEQQLDDTTAQLAQKVDKNGNEQVTWAMASQDFKEQITGGNTAVVGVNSVNTTNIVDKAVTARKRTVISDGVIVQAPHPELGKIPNIDTKNKTLTFYYDTTFFYRGYMVILSENTTIDLSVGASSSKKVFYDVIAKVFEVYDYNETVTNENEILICSVRLLENYARMSITCDYTIDGRSSVFEDRFMPLASAIVADNGYPILDGTNLILKPTIKPLELVVKDRLIQFPIEGFIIDLSPALEGTSAWFILFNVENKTFTVVPYTSLPQYTGSHVIFGSVRRASDGLKLNLPVPYIENDKLYGMVPLNSAVKNDPNALIKGVAHRGFSVEAPENTIPAFELAREKGYAYTECDVMFTAEGVPVLLHDDTIDRTSNGTGNVADFTLAELKALDFGSWKSETYAGVQIPTFEEFIKTCKRLSLRPFIELKIAMSVSQIEQLVNIVKRYNMLDHSVWTSFNYTNLTRVIDVEPNADVCNATISITPEYIQGLVNLKTGSNVVYAYPHYPALTSEAVNQIRENGLSIAVWTVNGVSDVMNLAELGVDVILTDQLNIIDLLES